MALPKSSRKGKKAWRKNIDTSKVERAVAKKSTDERKGLELSTKTNEDLFFVDKKAQPFEGIAGKREKRGTKVLRCQAILQGAHQARPVEGVTKKKLKGGPGLKAHRLKTAEQEKANKLQEQLASKAARSGRKAAPSHPVFDLWAEGTELAEAEEWAKQAVVKGKKQPTLRGKHSKSARERPLPSVAAVEVDGPGCSYNPDYEHQQDSIAEAVASEVYKEIRKDLMPKPPSQYVETDDALQMDELEQLLVDEEPDDAEGEGGDSPDDGEAATGAPRHVKKTKTKRNREKSAREAARELQERRRLKKQRHELSNLKGINAEIEREEEERALRSERKGVMEAEKAQSRTPRLGKTRFVDAPMQVLATDQVEHNLRRLKAHPMLVRDRFAALQKRGAIEPTRRVAKRERKTVVYETTNRNERAQKEQDELTDMKVSRQKMAKKLKKAGRL